MTELTKLELSLLTRYAEAAKKGNESGMSNYYNSRGRFDALEGIAEDFGYWLSFEYRDNEPGAYIKKVKLHKGTELLQSIDIDK